MAKMLIDGKWVGSEKTFDVVNPYTQEVVDTAPIATDEQINEAIEKAYHAKHNLTTYEKVKILNKIGDLIDEQRDELAKLISLESGLGLKHTTGEVFRTAIQYRLYAKMTEELASENVTEKYQRDERSQILTVTQEPKDCIVAITPFNHPLGQVSHKICPAIVSGSSLVLKPPEKTPLTALKLAGIMIEAGLPKNHVNMITGWPAQDIVKKMVTHPFVDMVTFTGGVEVGKSIKRMMVNGGKELTKYVAELGGNSALVILEDADLDRAAEIAMGAFDDSGQRCTSIKRILLHEKVADAFIEKLMKIAKEFTYGDPLNPDLSMGCIISKEMARTIQNRVNAAIEDGALLLLGNKREGSVYSPTVLDYVNPSSELVVKETFGPVAPIIRIKDIDEAVEMINNSGYGLAGAVVTESEEKAKYLYDKTKVGVFNWNGPPGFRSIMAPFGGFGKSGNGEKEGVLDGIFGMTDVKTFYAHPKK